MKALDDRISKTDQDLENWYLNVVACPLCKSELRLLKGGLLHCARCRTDYSIVQGIPVLLSPAENTALEDGLEPVKDFYYREEHYDWTKDPKALEFAYHRYRRWETWKEISKIIKPGNVVLDLGCGTGLITRRFIGRDTMVLALDLNRWALSQMDGKPWVTKVQGDGDSIPVQDECVDLVVATEMIEHLESPLTAAQEVYRICKPGAHVVGSVPSNSKVWQWRSHLSMTCGGGEPFHHNYDSEEIAGLWRVAGFKTKVRQSCLGLNWLWVLEKE